MSDEWFVAAAGLLTMSNAMLSCLMAVKAVAPLEIIRSSWRVTTFETLFIALGGVSLWTCYENYLNGSADPWRSHALILAAAWMLATVVRLGAGHPSHLEDRSGARLRT